MERILPLFSVIMLFGMSVFALAESSEINRELTQTEKSDYIVPGIEYISDVQNNLSIQAVIENDNIFHWKNLLKKY